MNDRDHILVFLCFQVNLVVPGPEQPLVDGIETFFRKGVCLSRLYAIPFYGH